MVFAPGGRYSFRSEGAGNKELGNQQRQRRLEAKAAEKAEGPEKEKAEEGPKPKKRKRKTPYKPVIEVKDEEEMEPLSNGF